MAKVLLGHHNIEQYIDRDAKSIQVDRSVIIPPGMKDYLQTEGINLIYVKPDELQKTVLQKEPEVIRENEGDDNCISEKTVAMLTTRIVSILKNEHQMTDKKAIERICLHVINQINQ